jgi:hypothetical protein
MRLEWFSITLSVVSLVTVLTGLWRTGAPVLRRMAACFAATLLLDVFGVGLKLLSSSLLSELTNLIFSFASTFALLMAGIDLLDAANKSAGVRKIILNSFPVVLCCYVIFHVLVLGLDSSNPSSPAQVLLAVLKLIDSASSISACAFIALALFARLFINEEFLLSFFTAFSFALWAAPESLYWQDGPLAAQLAMGLGGVLVAFTVTAAAHRRAI